MPNSRPEGRATPDGAAAVRTLSLPNEVAALETARLAMLDFVAWQGLSARSLYRLELVLEETLMNRVMHAFRDGGSHSIALTLRLEPDAVSMCFEDDGVAFDPQSTPEPGPGSAAWTQPGGRGWRLTRKAVRDWHYERIGDRNRLTLRVARD